MKDRHRQGYIDAYNHDVYHQISVRVRKDTGILDALCRMKDQTGISVNTYITDAVRRKLSTDGFLKDVYGSIHASEKEDT